MFQFVLAAFIMSVGVCIAGAGTHLYQWLSHEQAMLRYEGKTYLASLGNLAVSFVCGPYIMLQMGWHHEERKAVSVSSALVAALVAFGWAFVTGMLALNVVFAVQDILRA